MGGESDLVTAGVVNRSYDIIRQSVAVSEHLTRSDHELEILERRIYIMLIRPLRLFIQRGGIVRSFRYHDCVLYRGKIRLFTLLLSLPHQFV